MTRDNEMPSAALCRRLKRWASILRQPRPRPYTRTYGDDDYEAMAQAFDDAARALATADSEINGLTSRLEELLSPEAREAGRDVAGL
jgi:hypothetical protein